MIRRRDRRMPVSRTPPVPAPAAVAPGRRVYAIGDVHGCLDMLDALHRAVDADLAARPVRDATLVHLGDYVDRGPRSAGVLERLLTPARLPRCAVVTLMGNHEAMLLQALDGDGAMLRTWLAHGGETTLASWGIDVLADDPLEPDGWLHRLPAAQLGLLRRLPVCHRIDGYLFAHAGVRPDRPLREATTRDLLWMREPFLSWTGPLERVVVHGHTPDVEPVVRPHRIGIDTGAVFGGRLTCAVLEADRLSFLSVGAGD